MMHRKIVKPRSQSKSPLRPLSASSPTSTEKVQLVVRIRPAFEEQDPQRTITCEQHNCIKLKRVTTTSYMKFNKVLPQTASQGDAFCQIRGLIDSFLEGTSNTIFAYGQTGTGKTFTVFGPVEQDGSISLSGQERGILPRAIEYIMETAGSHTQLLLSFYEIYNQRIYDLFSEKDQPDHIDVRETKQGDVTIPQLMHYQVEQIEQAFEFLATGIRNRSAGQTAVNANSSRSHSVFQIVYRKEGVQSCLRIVDLAGSERFKIPYGLNPAQKQLRIQQLKFINGSLSCLGQCISALTQKSRTHIPFRNSKLTRVLSDCLMGKGRLAVIVCVSPSLSEIQQTTNTLQFAHRIKKANIQNLPKEVARSSKGGDYHQLFEEEKERRIVLESRLSQLEAELPRLQTENKRLREILQNQSQTQSQIQSQFSSPQQAMNKQAPQSSKVMIEQKVNSFFNDQDDDEKMIQKLSDIRRMVLSSDYDSKMTRNLFDKSALSEFQFAS